MVVWATLAFSVHCLNCSSNYLHEVIVIDEETNSTVQRPTHLPIGAPFRLRHLAIRFVMPGMSFAPLGYFLQAERMRLLKVETLSPFFSVFRNSSSAHAQTFSCGLRSGECAGHKGKTRMRMALKAASASRVCISVSPSKSNTVKVWPRGRAWRSQASC